jgi:endonuclease G
MVNFFTNGTPQFDTFNRGAWTQLERWVLTEHNSNTKLVSIFTGPVLTDENPIIRGVEMPRSFRKIAVSRRDTFTQSRG